MAKGSNRKWSSPSRFPRTARVNELLREILATTLEEFSDEDPRLEMVTVTGVDCSSDIGQATVYFSALIGTPLDDVIAALEENRVELQAAIGSQVRLKRTPLLRFRPDPAIIGGQKIEGILSVIRRGEGEGDGGEADRG